jgi:hypothetical protein
MATFILARRVLSPTIYALGHIVAADASERDVVEDSSNEVAMLRNAKNKIPSMPMQCDQHHWQFAHQ